MSDNNRNDRTLHVLPTAPELARERASEERLDAAPRSVQDWFDATAEDLAMDARLRRFADELAPDPDAEIPDEPTPAVIGAWLAATASDPEVDARLAAFVDELVPAEDATAPATAPRPVPAATPATTAPSAANDTRGWRSTLGGTVALVAAAALALWALVPEDQTVSPVAPAQLADAAPGDASPAAASSQDDAAPKLPAPLSSPASDAPASDAPASDALAQAPSEPAAPLTPPPAEAPPSKEAGVDELEELPVDADAPTVVVVAQTDEADPADMPDSPDQAASPQVEVQLLATAGEIAAAGAPWRGDVVPGLDLRLDRGFGRLAGVQSAPVLDLAEGSEVRVELDRDAVSEDFRTFTITTLSAEIEVVGTRYDVDVIDGFTTVRTRRGLVRVACADGTTRLVSAGQEHTCAPEPDVRVLSHMVAMDKPVGTDGPRLSLAERYEFLSGLVHSASPGAVLSSAEVMRSRAIADADYRKLIELVRIDTLCELGWDDAARDAARTWSSQPLDLAADHVDRIAEDGCDG